MENIVYLNTCTINMNSAKQASDRAGVGVAEKNRRDNFNVYSFL